MARRLVAFMVRLLRHNAHFPVGYFEHWQGDDLDDRDEYQMIYDLSLIYHLTHLTLPFPTHKLPIS